jgi:hypothetical protein
MWDLALHLALLAKIGQGRIYKHMFNNTAVLIIAIKSFIVEA